MGYSEERPAILPNPRGDKEKAAFEAFGFKCLTGGPEHSVMGEYVVPHGWGMLISSDRGDIVYAGVADPTGRGIFDIFWMSKGAYDNKARITLCSTKKPQYVNLEHYVLNFDTGFYKLGPQHKEHCQFVDDANAYAEAQYRGATQSQLDKMYEALTSKWKEGYPVVAKCVAQERGNLHDVAMACTVAFARPYSHPSVEEWITRGAVNESDSDDSGDSD